MPELTRLDASHTRAVLAFEPANRAYFPVAEADASDLGGKPGTWYQRDLPLRQ
ncbi:hypothetical protein [Actinomadura harenae]|uniref:hypothetical protein n=1 Tax=Actinomadura harenae TaxID=2483351 RepID=UPI001315416B|nr:hypothetical protein [Actinomadura harenae]